MKAYKLIVTSCLISFCSFTFAAEATADHQKAVTKTDLSKNWNCTTNASTSNTAEDKKADEDMSKNKSSLKKSIGLAEKHCRDCTKITCEMSGQ